MSVTAKLNAAIKSSRQRMQAGRLQSAEKLAPKTGAISSGSKKDRKGCST